MNIKIECTVGTFRGENDFVYLAHILLDGRKVTLYDENFVALLSKIQQLYKRAQEAQ